MNFSDSEALRLTLEQLAANSTQLANAVDPAYRRAIVDLLQLFGILQVTEAGPVAADDTARWLLKSLVAHLTDDLPLAHWYDAKILAAVEAARYKQQISPAPVREVFAANGLIKSTFNGHAHLLMQYDTEAGQFQLIGGKREIDDQDIAFTLLREIREELNCPQVTTPADLTLVPFGKPYEKITLSPTYGVISSYHITFFHVQSMRFQPEIDTLTDWVDLAFIRAGAMPDGRRISTLAIDVFGDSIDMLTDSLLNPISAKND